MRYSAELVTSSIEVEAGQLVDLGDGHAVPDLVTAMFMLSDSHDLGVGMIRLTMRTEVVAGEPRSKVEFDLVRADGLSAWSQLPSMASLRRDLISAVAQRVKGSQVRGADELDQALTRRRPITDTVLRRVAKVYLEALADGRPVTRAVADHFAVSDSQASKYIHKARRAGLLPATEPGKKGGA